MSVPLLAHHHSAVVIGVFVLFYAAAAVSYGVLIAMFVTSLLTPPAMLTKLSTFAIFVLIP